MEGDNNVLFGLANSNGIWSCRSVNELRKSDQSNHQFSVSIDGKKDRTLNFRTAKDQISITWHIDSQGRALATTYSRDTRTSLVPNSKYAKELQDELEIWTTRLTPPMAWGGRRNHLVGEWKLSDGTIWQFSEFKPREDNGEMTQGASTGRYSYEVPGRVKIEMPSGTNVYEIRGELLGQKSILTLLESGGQKLEFTRAK